MKKSLLFVLMMVILSTGVMASSINFPTAVFKDQDFKLQQNTGAVDCDMPNTGSNICVVAWASPDGTDDGGFSENPANPDPDSGNRWQKFSVVGTYSVTITECYGGLANCSSTPSDTNTVEVLDPALIGDVSMEFYYYNPVDNLGVKGYAPAGAKSAKIMFINPSGGYAETPSCVSVTQGNEPEFQTTLHPKANNWDDVTYSPYVAFYNDTSCGSGGGSFIFPTAYSGEFDWLAIEQINDNLDSLTYALNDTNATLQSQIDDLYSITYNTSTNITEIWNEIDNLWDAIEAMNHGTLNLFYRHHDGESPELNVWGKAPLGATTATVYIYDLNENLLYMNTTAVTTIVGEPNMYAFWYILGTGINVSALPPQKYNVLIFFDNSFSLVMSAPFDDLYLEYLGSWLDEHESWLANNTAWLNELNGTVGNHTQQIIDLQNNITVIQGEISDIQDNISDIYNNLTSVWHHLDDLEDSVDVQWRYNADEDKLWVKGYAPEGAASAKIQWRDSNNNNIPGGDLCVPVDQDESPEFSLSGFGPYHPVADNWADDTYNLRVNFYDTTGCTGGGAHRVRPNAIGGEFDWLAIQNLTARLDALETRVTNLENNVTALWDAVEDLEDMAFITFDYYSEEYGGPSLDIYGYAPSSAQSVEVWFFGSLSGEEYSYCMPVDQDESPEFSMEDIDLSNWEVDSYAIEGYFYDQAGCAGNDVEPMAYGGTFDDLLNDWLHENALGFGLMDTQTFEVWNPQSSFIRKFSWAFTAPEDGWYWFELIQKNSDNGEDISKTFAGGSAYWIDSHDTRYFRNRNIRFPALEGSYKVLLKAHNMMTGQTYKSNAFRLIIDDLSQPWPENTAGVREITVAGYSNTTGTYWSNENSIPAAADLISNIGWSRTDKCEVFYPITGGQDSYYWNDFTNNGTNATCSGDLRLSENDDGFRNFGMSSGDTKTIEICAHPTEPNNQNLYAAVCGEVTVGYDTEAPVIDEESLNPGEYDVLSGNWTFSANISDDGEIASVSFWLTNKTNGSQTYLVGYANNTNGIWVVTRDTLDWPDGYYNFTVNATDYAGNSATLTIDPVIDNTAPQITDYSVEGNVGEGYTVTASVIDQPNTPNPITGEMPEGVVRVIGELVPYACNTPMSECSLTWCEDVEEETVVCENQTILNETCFAEVSEENCSTLDISSPEYQECLDAAMDYCSDTVENCSNQTVVSEECGYTGNCRALEMNLLLVCQEGIPCEKHYTTVQDCLDSCEDTECESQCYNEYCNITKEAKEESVEVSCDDKCVLTDCVYDPENEELSGAVPITLTLVEGTGVNGVWKADLDGDSLVSGLHYALHLEATDAANNTNTTDSENASGNALITAHPSYEVTITSDAAEPTDRDVFSVSGTISSSDGSDLPEEYSLLVAGEETPLLLNSYSREVGPLSSGTQTITAKYKPYPACDETYTATTDVEIKHVYIGGGGGGGGFPRGTGTSENNEGDQPKEPKKQEAPKEDKRSRGTGATEEQAGTTEEQKSSSSENTEKSEPDNNLLTGRATGDTGKGATVKWLGILAGVIVILLGASWLIRKK